MNTTADAYRAASLQDASHLDLLLATYDVLARDLRLAGIAVEQGHIAERCRLSGHALILLGHLESWTLLLNEPVLEISLTQFYTFLRNEIMRNQAAPTSEHFVDLALFVCEIRAAWQNKGSSQAASNCSNPLQATSRNAAGYEESRVAVSFSA